MIVGVAMSSAAPLISKTMKNSQVGNFQIMRLNRDLDSIRKDITNIKKNYVTKSALTETLRNYVTSDALTATLRDYAKTSDLPDLTNYLTAGDLNGYVTSGTLDNYVTAAQLQSALANIQIPSGTIAFFDSNKHNGCPPNWTMITSSDYNERFLQITTTASNAGQKEDAVLPQHRHATGTASYGSGWTSTSMIIKNYNIPTEESLCGNGVKGDGRSTIGENVSEGAMTSREVYGENVEGGYLMPTTKFDNLKPKSILVIACKKD